MDISRYIQEGSALLGIELGSTRIKGVVIHEDGTPLASGSFTWENQLIDGIWTYDLSVVETGIAACYRDLVADVQKQYNVVPSTYAGIGISGMMHGYIALNEDGELLVPFRTWRNNITGAAAKELTELFQYPIPQRWSIAHLYQAILNGEEHVSEVRRITTLAAYVHWRLTGQWAIGVNEASGMFPIDPPAGTYYARMISAFDDHVASRNFPWKLNELLPEVVPVGDVAGTLSPAGARLLDETGVLVSGIPLCPPEGDAGTGMVATNSVRVRTGNVSAGTSVFAMVVLEKELSQIHPQIDRVVTPDSKLVAMAHSNNCTSDFDAWMSVFGEVSQVMGGSSDLGDVYSRLMPLALQGDPDAGGLLAYGYLSGEHMTGFTEGRPLFVRRPDSSFTLANLIRVHLFTALGALRTGLNILLEEEGVPIEELRGHGGFFKTPEVGQRIMAMATETPVSVLETAGEGGAWGMALLASFMKRRDRAQDLPTFLDHVFAGGQGKAYVPDEKDVEGFRAFFARYTAGLAVERAAVETV